MTLCMKFLPTLLLWRMQARNIWAIRMGDWKLVAAHAWHELPSSVGKPRLINLGSDPGEVLDVSAQNPEKFAELKAAFAAWEKTLPEPLWTTDVSPEAVAARHARTKRQQELKEKQQQTTPKKP